MIEKTLSRRYASALLILAEEENAVERIESEILLVADAYKKSAELRLILAHPRIAKSQKIALIERLFRGKVHNLLYEFLRLLIDKSRIQFITEIAESFDEIADMSKGLVPVKVKTYFSLSKEKVDVLNTNLTALIKKKLLLDVSEDRTLKGGLVIRIGDRMLDGSVAGRLKNLKERLYEGLHSL